MKSCDILIHEAQQQRIVSIAQQELAFEGQDRLSHISQKIQDFHSSPIEAAKIANKVKAKLLVLTHLSPPFPRFIAKPFFLYGVDNVRNKGVVVGYDGLVVTLNPDKEKPVLTDIN